MGLVDQGLHLGVGAQVRVDLGEVGDPVAVVAGAGVGAAALHRAVLERRRQPDRGRPETLDVVELVGDPLQVATVVEALVTRVVAGGQAIAGQAPAVVRGRAVGEPVGHHEVEPLLGQTVAQAVGRQPPVPGGDAVAAEIGRGDGRLVGGVVVDHPDLGRPGEHQRAVGLALGAVGAVALVPRVVERDLVLPRPLREREDRAVGGPGGVLGQLRRGTRRLPVGGQPSSDWRLPTSAAVRSAACAGSGCGRLTSPRAAISARLTASARRAVRFGRWLREGRRTQGSFDDWTRWRIRRCPLRRPGNGSERATQETT